MFYRKWLMLTGAALLLSACTPVPSTDTIIANRDNEYVKAKNIPPLVIPHGLSSSTIQASFPIPEKEYPQTRKQVDILPPGL